MANKIRNGMPAAHLVGAAWRKSSYSGAVGNCVELARAGREAVAMRNSRDPQGPALVCAHSRMSAFLAAVKGGALPTYP